MKFKSILIAAVSTLFTVLGMGTSQATLIDLTSYAAQPGNSGGAIPVWMNAAVDAYNAASDPDLPSANNTEAFRNNQGEDHGPSGFPTFGSSVTSLDIPVAGYEYLALHWGGPKKAGSNNLQANYQLIYIGDPMGATVYSASNIDGHGLSWYALSNPTNVPDGGATLALLGLSLLGLGKFRRYLLVRRKK